MDFCPICGQDLQKDASCALCQPAWIERYLRLMSNGDYPYSVMPLWEGLDRDWVAALRRCLIQDQFDAADKMYLAIIRGLKGHGVEDRQVQARVFDSYGAFLEGQSRFDEARRMRIRAQRLRQGPLVQTPKALNRSGFDEKLKLSGRYVEKPVRTPEQEARLQQYIKARERREALLVLGTCLALGPMVAVLIRIPAVLGLVVGAGVGVALQWDWLKGRWMERRKKE